MAPTLWPLHNDRPIIEVILSPAGGQDVIRILIADTAAGTSQSVFQLILAETDCLQCGGIPAGHVKLGGAYLGPFPIYLLEVHIPQLNFKDAVPVAGVTQVPDGFDGIAGFKFLSRFHHGNFGDPSSWGLEVLAFA
jgi:hypothetical protein